MSGSFTSGNQPAVTGHAGDSTGGSGGSTAGAVPPLGGAVRGSAPAGAVSVGLLWVSNAQSQIAAVGAKNLTPDMHAGEQALVDDLNTHGGLAGHRIVPVFHAFDDNATNLPVEWQKACTDLTQDHHVFAVLAPGLNDPAFSGCLARAGVIEVSALLTTEGKSDFAAAPLLVEPASMNLDRLADVEPRQLVAQGWLANRSDAPPGADPKPKIGVVAFDKPSFREAFDHHLKPAYAALGTPIAEEAFVGDTADQLGTQLPGIVLRFAQEGINHVTFLTSTGLPPGLFLIQATKQEYKPRYGFSSQDAMGVVIQDEPDPRGQLHQAASVGWFPEADVADYEAPGNAQPSQPRCLALMRAHQITASDGNSAGIDDYMCDSLWYLV